MMKHKTSTKISLKFTLFSTILLLFFGFFINMLFFGNWYYIQNQRLEVQLFRNKPGMINMIGRQSRNIIKIQPINNEESKQIIKNVFWKNISKIDDNYYLFSKNLNEIAYIDVSQEMDSQKHLLFISFYVILGFAFLSYIISRWFVVSSLKGLKKLSLFVAGLHFDNLNQKINLPGPDNDELKIIANGLNEALSRLGEQAETLKDFVKNASHELKTPLMVINSEADLALKSQKYVSGIKNIKGHLKYLDNLIEHLLLITKLDSGIVFEKKEIDIIPSIENNINNLEEQYKDKKISINKNIPNYFPIKTHEGIFNIIIRNIVDNAFRYTEKGGNISITLEKKQLSIKDDGIGIDEKNINKIWERFWKEDGSRTGEEYSFGLGLHLVKKLCKNQNLKIDVKSKKGEGSTFIIDF